MSLDAAGRRPASVVADPILRSGRSFFWEALRLDEAGNQGDGTGSLAGGPSAPVPALRLPAPRPARPWETAGDWAPRAVVCLPTYDERENLEAIIAAIHAAAPDIDVLVIDDESPDGTGELAEQLAAREPGVQVLHRPPRGGLGTAYLSGFRWALKRHYDLIVQMEADFSHDPRYLPRLLERARDAHVVIGSRYVPGGQMVNWSRARMAAARWGNLYARLVLGAGVRDLTSGFKCFRRQVLEALDLPTVARSAHALQIELTYRALLEGFSVVEVPVVTEQRRAGRSKRSFGAALAALWAAWSMRAPRSAQEKAAARSSSPVDYSVPST